MPSMPLLFLGSLITVPTPSQSHPIGTFFIAGVGPEILGAEAARDEGWRRGRTVIAVWI